MIEIAAVFLHTAAFLICMGVQWMGSPLAGAWLLFHVAGCALLLYNGKYDPAHGIVWCAALGWMLALGIGTFLVMPVPGGAATMWILLAAPSLALCIRKERLPLYLKAFGGLITLYAAGLIIQKLLHVHYSMYNLGDIYAWPLLDPNNGAAVINLAAAPCVWLAVFRDKRYWLLLALLLGGMWATHSRAGFGAFGIAAALVLSHKYGVWAFLAAILTVYAGAALALYFYPDAIADLPYGLESRFPIWESGWLLAGIRPWTGLGLGMFAYYYQQVRTENYTQGGFAHNDLLQLVIEMGWPLTLVFIVLLACVTAATWRGNLPAAAAMLAVCIQAMLEFQFYVPAVSYPLGLAMGYHIIHRRPS